MAVESHSPSPRGLLCNAGAGAAAGGFFDCMNWSIFRVVEEISLNIRVESSGVLAATFVCPLDVIKTRFQVHGLPKLNTSTSVKGMNVFFGTFFSLLFCGNQLCISLNIG